MALKKQETLHLVIALVTLLPIIGLSLFSCKKEALEKPKLPPPSKLHIFALQELRDSGYESVVLKQYAKTNNTSLQVTLFPDLPALLDALNLEENKAKVDLVMGIDNAFAISDSLLKPFSPILEVSLSEISTDIPKDPERRLIPYAQSQLAFLYNSRIFPQPPQSFGELQDARFYSQLGVCDPKSDGLGRNTLFWSAAIFGNSGFEQFWTSLRKNVRKVYNNRSDLSKAVRKGECGIALGLHSYPAWIEEFYPSETHIKSVIPEEGSFQYIESAAICNDAPNRATAVKFLQHIISAEEQQFVMYKLALMPVNGRTVLSRSFSALPFYTFSHNDRLRVSVVTDNLQLWLEKWENLITLNLIH